MYKKINSKSENHAEQLSALDSGYGPGIRVLVQYRLFTPIQ